MSYANDYVLANSVTFQNQVQMAMIVAAIQQSGATPVNAAVDAKRNDMSYQILNSPSPFLVYRFALAAIEAETLVIGATDAQVLSAVDSVFSAVAGVTQTDITGTP